VVGGGRTFGRTFVFVLAAGRTLSVAGFFVLINRGRPPALGRTFAVGRTDLMGSSPRAEERFAGVLSDSSGGKNFRGPPALVPAGLEELTKRLRRGPPVVGRLPPIFDRSRTRSGCAVGASCALLGAGASVGLLMSPRRGAGASVGLLKSPRGAGLELTSDDGLAREPIVLLGSFGRSLTGDFSASLRSGFLSTLGSGSATSSFCGIGVDRGTSRTFGFKASALAFRVLTSSACLAF